MSGPCPRCGWEACALWRAEAVAGVTPNLDQLAAFGIACAIQAVATRLGEQEQGAQQRHREIRDQMDGLTDNMQTVLDRGVS